MERSSFLIESVKQIHLVWLCVLSIYGRNCFTKHWYYFMSNVLLMALWMNEWMMTDWEMGWVRVGLLWDKQHETHIVRKSTLRLQTFWSLVLIGPILNKIQLFENLKIYKRCMDCRTHRSKVYIFPNKFWSFWMAVSCSILKPDKHHVQTWECC